ncbi:MAG: GntR family transcriptional regulator [Anaerolineales bacterium]|nr:GntR family transcriptional regulator [Anaerolineales bacterium]
MRIAVDPSSTVPLYAQVKDAIRAHIAGGELKPGDRLPGEVAWGEQLGISRMTIHRALRELVNEGLLIRQRARGTFVAVPRRDKVMVEGPLFSLTEELTRDGLAFSNRILAQAVIAAAPDIAADLRLPAGAPVVRLLSLRTVGRQSFALEEMRYPFDRFPAMATLDLNNRSTYATLEAEYNAHPDQAVDHITAGTATAAEARLLGLKPGRPVLRVRRVSYDASGQPVESTVATFLADRYRIVARVFRRALRGWDSPIAPTE